MSIIVEGPDGAGKTTLIQHLQYEFPDLRLHPRFCTSEGGPIDDLAHAVWSDHMEIGNKDWIYDRHPVFSEYIYAHEIPGRSVAPVFLDLGMSLITQRIQRESLVIFCIPPLEVVKANLADEMPGVVENIDQIHEAYRIRAAQYSAPHAVYDYTRADSLARVTHIISNYIRGV